MHSVGQKIIATYHTETTHIEFKKDAGKVFAVCVLNGSAIQYPLDPSLAKIQAVPIALHTSARKTIKWLLNNQFIPVIQDDKLVFCNPSVEEQAEPTIHSLLGISPPETKSSSQDIESEYCAQLVQAKRDENFQYQVFYLERLSELYVQKKNWTHAAKLLNAALAILNENLNNPSCQSYLIARLEKLQILFLANYGILSSLPLTDSFLSDRIWLYQVRSLCIKQFQAGHPVQEILSSLTDSYKTFLSTLILDAQRHLDPPPTEWACIGMGSMARNEMCPYSDLEFAFIINDKTEAALKYFRILAQLIELKIINLGETKFPLYAQLFGHDHSKASPTKGGFSLDTGGNTPLGKPGYYELIDTPEGLAQYQSTEWMDGDIIVTNALSSICYIAGARELAQRYHNIKEDQLNNTDGLFFFTGTLFREKLAIKLLEGNIREFKPDLSKEKQETKAFGIKKELYRPLQSLLGCLNIYYGLQCTSTFTIIDELLSKNILSKEGARNLTQALEHVLSLRFEAHNFYQNEQEFLLHVDMSEQQDPHYFYLTPERIELLYEVYKVLIPFHQKAEKFLKNQTIKTFTGILRDDSPYTQGKAFERMLQFTQAHKAFQQAVSLNPNSILFHISLGVMEDQIGKSQDALLRYLQTWSLTRQALSFTQQKYGENHPKMTELHDTAATVCMKLGEVYMRLGDYNRALEFLQKHLKIGITWNNKDLYTARSYRLIGSVYNKIGQYNNASEYHKKSLAISLRLWGENHSDVAASLNDLGLVNYELGKYSKALEYHQRALKILLPILGENHPKIAVCFNNIGIACSQMGEYDQALRHYQQALKIGLSILGENHPDIAKSYNNMGTVHTLLKEYDQALECHQKALTIVKLLGENHPDVALSYNNIGIIYDQLGKYNETIEYHQMGLKIWLSVFDENHPKVAHAYNNIGLVYGKNGEFDRAIEYHQKALHILLRAYGENHPLIEKGLENLIYCARKASMNTVKGLYETLILCTRILGKEHRLVRELAQLIAQTGLY